MEKNADATTEIQKSIHKRRRMFHNYFYSCAFCGRLSLFFDDMKKKRPTPRKLPSGSWNCIVTVNGQRVSITDESNDLCQARAIAIQSGLIEKEEKRKSITLEDAIEEYIKDRDGVLSPSTVRGYGFIKRKRFKSLMKRDIFTFAQKDVQAAINAESKGPNPPSAKTIENAWHFVNSVLKSNGIYLNGIRLPQKKKYEGSFVQRSQISSLIEQIRGDSCEVPILLAVWLGMRRGEIMGIHWDAINYEAKTITIKRTVVMDENDNFVTRELAKNEISQRKIKCPDYILDILKEMQIGRTEGPCFTMHPNTILKHVHRACEKAGINDTTTHGLRHTNAAVMRSLGISDAHAMNRGGWTEERTYKQVYSYVFDEAEDEEDRAIDEFFLLQTSKMQTKNSTIKPDPLIHKG